MLRSLLLLLIVCSLSVSETASVQGQPASDGKLVLVAVLPTEDPAAEETAWMFDLKSRKKTVLRRGSVFEVGQTSATVALGGAPRSARSTSVWSITTWRRGWSINWSFR